MRHLRSEAGTIITIALRLLTMSYCYNKHQQNRGEFYDERKLNYKDAWTDKQDINWQL
jgi:hypothetical protein